MTLAHALKELDQLSNFRRRTHVRPFVATVIKPAAITDPKAARRALVAAHALAVRSASLTPLETRLRASLTSTAKQLGDGTVPLGHAYSSAYATIRQAVAAAYIAGARDVYAHYRPAAADQGRIQRYAAGETTYLHNLLSAIARHQLSPAQLTQRVELWVTALRGAYEAGKGAGATALVTAVQTRRKYSEDEARDERGRWTDDGGGETAASPFLGGLQASDFPYGRVPGMVSQYQEFVDTHPDSGMPRGQLEWTVEQQDAARQSLVEAIRTQEPTTNLPMAGFLAFLDDGTLRNQFETGRTGAATGASENYEPIRRAQEERSFGVPNDAAPADRPVYGYLAPGDRADFLRPDNPAELRSAIEYLPSMHKEGAIDKLLANPDNYFVSIDPGKGAYTEVGTHEYYQSKLDMAAKMPPGKGDAWLASAFSKTAYYPLGDGHGGLNGEVIAAYANREYSATSYGDIQVTFKRDLLDHSTVTGGDSIDMRLMAVPARMAEAADPRIPIGMVMGRTNVSNRLMGNYTELQYHTHPTLSTVDHVTFKGPVPSKAVQTKLAAANIPWTHDPMPKLRISDRVSFTDITGWRPKS